MKRISIQDFFALLAAPFFPLFFVPLIRVGSSSLEANFIAALVLSFSALLYLNTIMKSAFIRQYVLIPWLLLFASFLLSTILLGERESFIQFFAQCVFLLAACGLAATISVWYRSQSRYFSIFIGMLIGSYFIALFLRASGEDFWGIWSNLITADVWSLIRHARRAFNPDSFSGGVSLEVLANNHNRIAQQTFSLGFFVLTVSLLSGHLLGRFFKVFYIGFAVLMIWLSLFLMSGQSMGQILLTVMFCASFSFFLKPSLIKVILFFVVPIFILGLLAFIAQTTFGEAWITRLSSGNIDTGRVVRWVYYWNESPDWTVIGKFDSLPIDPHNMPVSIFFELGIFATILYLIFLIGVLSRSFSGASSIYERFGVGGLMALSVGVQMIFVMMIAGGYGFPGWAEMSKFSLFLLIVLLMKDYVRPIGGHHGQGFNKRYYAYSLSRTEKI